MDNTNRRWNAKNPYQGAYKKVLCVCSAGLLRSPTAAFVLANEPFNFNTRACGIDADHALIPLDDVLIEWADEIICMNDRQYVQLTQKTKKRVINLQIDDSFEYRDPILIELIRQHYLNLMEVKESNNEVN